MARRTRFAFLILCLSALALVLSSTVEAQRRGDRRSPPPRPPHAAMARGHVVFIGGYFYDPFFGPYPWWPRPMYPYPYFPMYDSRAEVRVQVTPRESAVYVDGFYAGIADDFDGFLQRLPLPPGGHLIALYLPGYQTARHNVYLQPGSMLTLHDTLERLPAGMTSDAPPVAPPVPTPPPGSYLPPRTPPRVPLPSPAPVAEGDVRAAGYGTLDLRVQPLGAEVTIDGQKWISTEEGHFVVQISDGPHKIEVFKPGYRRFSSEVHVRDGQSTPLNVSLAGEKF